MRRTPLPLVVALAAALGPSAGGCGNPGSATDGGDADASPPAPDLAPAMHSRARARAEPAFGYDPGANRVVFFGGDDGPEVATVLHPSYHDDTWLYDVAASNWSMSSAKGPMARGRAAFAMDPIGHRLIVALGRYRDANATGTKPFTLLADAWAYDVARDAWSPLAATGAPAGRSAPVAVFDATRCRMVVFGGDLSTSSDPIFRHQSTNETWALSLCNGAPAWTMVNAQGTPPPGRYLAAAALDGKRDRMLVFGGVDEMGSFYNDTWALDLATDTWSQLDDGSSGPSQRLGPGAAYDAASDALLVFGGHDLSSIGHVNDTFSLALAMSPPTWSQIGDGDQPMNATLGCAGNASEAPFDFVTVDGKSPERRERMLLVAAGAAGAILFGGEGDCAQLDDTWSLVAGATPWTKRVPAAHGESCARRGEQCACLCN